jgi:hypothetical protein
MANWTRDEHIARWRKGTFLCQEQKPERDHPESKDWQESDDSADDQQQCDRNAHPPRRWPSEPTQEPPALSGSSSAIRSILRSNRSASRSDTVASLSQSHEHNGSLEGARKVRKPRGRRNLYRNAGIGHASAFYETAAWCSLSYVSL